MGSNKGAMNLQDSFLNQVRKENQQITMILLDGEKLTGTVRGFDNFTVIMQTENSQHMVYKHAIAQVVQNRTAQEAAREMAGSRGRGDRRRPESGGGRTPSSQPSGGEKFNKMDLSNVKDEMNKEAVGESTQSEKS